MTCTCAGLRLCTVARSAYNIAPHGVRIDTKVLFGVLIGGDWVGGWGIGRLQQAQFAGTGHRFGAPLDLEFAEDFRLWPFTVSRARKRRSLMSRFERPWAMSRRTSSSRWLNGSTRAGGRAQGGRRIAGAQAVSAAKAATRLLV